MASQRNPLNMKVVEKKGWKENQPIKCEGCGEDGMKGRRAWEEMKKHGSTNAWVT